MNSRAWWIIFLVLFLGLALAVTLVFRQAVREQLVLPLEQFIYFLRQVWNSIDSDRIWSLFILVLYVVMVLSLPVFRRPLPYEEPGDVRYARGGRLSYWRHVVHRLRSSQRLTRFSTLDIKSLAVNIVAFRRQCSLRQAELWMQDPENRPLVPEQVSLLFSRSPQAVVLARNRLAANGLAANGPAPKGLAPVGLAAKILQMLKTRLRITPGLPSAARPPVTNAEIESIILFLETQLEVDHDQHPRL